MKNVSRDFSEFQNSIYKEDMVLSKRESRDSSDLKIEINQEDNNVIEHLWLKYQNEFNSEFVKESKEQVYESEVESVSNESNSLEEFGCKYITDLFEDMIQQYEE